MKPALTTDKSAIRNFIAVASYGITYETLQLLTDDSSKNLTARQILSLIRKKNGSYTFTNEDKEYLMYITSNDIMYTYIFKFGKHEEDTAKFQFMRIKNTILGNCFFMIDTKTKQVICNYDLESNKTKIFQCAMYYFPQILCIPKLNCIKNKVVINISLEDSIAIGLEQVIQPYKILCELDN